MTTSTDAHRWTAPPNWPQPPEGWTPPTGWEPDAAWGPAPDGWQFWRPTAVHIPTQPGPGVESPALSGASWLRNRWVHVAGAGVIGLLLGAAVGAADGGDEERLRQELASAQTLAETNAELARTTEAQLATAKKQAADAQAAADGAKSAAEAEIKGRADELAAKEAQLVEREKAVGLAVAEVAANTFEGNGVYIVGDDIQPGTYKSDGGELCYWARHDKANDILDNHLGAGPTVVVVRATDFSLEVNGCAPFRKTG